MKRFSKELRVFPTIWDRIVLRLIFLIKRIAEKDTEWLLRVLKYLGYNHAFAIKVLQCDGMKFTDAEKLVFESKTWKKESLYLKRSTELIRSFLDKE